MEGDSRFSYGGAPSRMDRPQDEFMIMPVHSTLAQPRMAAGANALDLTSAIAHELRRSSGHPGWHAQLGGSQSSSPEAEAGVPMPYGPFLSQQPIPQYIPRFDENLQPYQLPARFDHSYTTESTESFVSAHQEFFSGSAPAQQVLRADSMRSCVPWIERMMQSDVTPTPSPSGPSLGISAKRGAAAEVSCVASQSVDLQSCHSSGRQKSAFSCNPQHESTVDLSADFCTDDEDLDTRPVDVKRRKRMLSNRASAQRSRQRRQERLDQLEVLTAQLRVENSTLQKKLSAAMQLAKKFEDQSKNLVKKVERLTKEVKGDKKARKPIAAMDECASSQQTTCASSCEMVGGRLSVDPNMMRDGSMNDGASTPSMSPRSSGWPSGTNVSEKEMEAVSNGNAAEVSPVRKCFSACRMGSKKRSLDQSEGGSHSTSVGNHMGSESMGLQQHGRPFSYEACNPLGLDPTMKEYSNAECLEADRWLEFADCFL